MRMVTVIAARQCMRVWASIDNPMFDFIVFVMQEPGRLLVSRHPVCVYVLPLTFLKHLSSQSTLRASA
jgi:hypothetical protein